MIRAARAGDAAGIVAIWNPVIRDTIVTFNSVEKTEGEVVALIAEKEAAGFVFLVAEAEGAVVGLATYGQFRGGFGYRKTVEHTIVLGPEARGRGFGRALLAEIEGHARASGHHSIWAGVSGENEDGAAFHARMGYEFVAKLSEVGRKFERWHDLVLMQKRL
jgi:phosphinothricin acetyltransferase